MHARARVYMCAARCVCVCLCATVGMCVCRGDTAPNHARITLVWWCNGDCACCVFLTACTRLSGSFRLCLWTLRQVAMALTMLCVRGCMHVCVHLAAWETSWHVISWDVDLFLQKLVSLHPPLPTIFCYLPAERVMTVKKQARKESQRARKEPMVSK